jgi:hypothetical protein
VFRSEGTLLRPLTQAVDSPAAVASVPPVWIFDFTPSVVAPSNARHTRQNTLTISLQAKRHHPQRLELRRQLLLVALPRVSSRPQSCSVISLRFFVHQTTTTISLTRNCPWGPWQNKNTNFCALLMYRIAIG